MNKQNKFGFTLIELVVSIAVLLILSSVTLAVLNPFEQFKKAQDSRRKNDLAQVQRALEAYYQDHGSYPPSNGTDIEGAMWGNSWSPYINILPKDPDSSKKYVYKVSSNQQMYWIFASLDRGAKDPQVCNNGNDCANVPSYGACGASATLVVCNYGISSPNTSP